MQLDDVNQKYKAATEEADQLKKKLVLYTDRRDRYKTWVSELDLAEDNARQICHQLEIIASQSVKIWYNTCRAVQAIEILYCMITDFYFQVDGLRKEYDALVTCVNNNHDPAIGKGTGILKYADEYLQKLEAVIKTRDDIVKPALEAIKLANLIRNSISTRECPAPIPKDPKSTDPPKYDPCNPTDELCPDCCDDKNRYYGFKAVICEWYNEFKCKVECIEEDPCPPDPNKQQTPTPAPPKKDCDETQVPPQLTETCKLEPVFEFPICNDTYKKSVKTWLTEDEKTVKKLAQQVMEKSKLKESLQACKDSLTKAVNEVNPKERCK